MKVLIISNKLTVEVSDDIQVAFKYLEQKTPLKYALHYLQTDFQPQYKSFGVGNYWGTTGTKEKIAPLLKEPYDVIIFLYGVQGYTVGTGGVLTGWTLWEGLNGAEFIEIPCSPYGDAIKFIDKAISHEVIHALCMIAKRKGRPVVDEMDVTKDGQAYLHNDNPNHPDGNYARTLKNLVPHWDVFTATKPPVIAGKNYKYFKASEVVGLKHEFVLKLDKIREEYGFPMVITSGFRTKAQNDALKDSASDSAHLSGNAVDVACTDSFRRFKLIKVALANGIRRIGVGNGFIHLDISQDKQQDVLWDYYK